ncbi:MAG: DUF1559 domain-containing protein [Verrucomicrobiales bacterium]|nr:DUF1559 domain-containing protein [Verrucomicrobiales bacterium]
MRAPPTRTTLLLRTGTSEHGFSLVELLVVIAILALLASILLPAISSAKESARRIQCINNLRQLSVTWEVYADDHGERLPVNGYGTPETLGPHRLWVVGDTHRNPPSFTNESYLLDPKHAGFAGYLQSASVYKCPSDRVTIEIDARAFPKTRSYSLNGYLGWQAPNFQSSFLSPNHQLFLKSGDLGAASPANLFQFVDTAPGNICHSAFVVAIDPGLKGLYYHLPSAQHGRRGNLTFVDGHVETHRWKDKETTELARERWIPDHLTLQYPGNADLAWLQERASQPKGP